VRVIKQMHRLLYRQGLTLAAARAAIAELPAEDAQQDVAMMLDLLDASSRGIVR
jgi:UDP-N-acetylglucosamine acyltransferase